MLEVRGSNLCHSISKNSTSLPETKWYFGARCVEPVSLLPGIYGSTDFAKSRNLQGEEKRLRLYFEQFFKVLPLKHVLKYMLNQTMCTNVLKTLKKAQRPKRPQIQQNLTTLKQKCVAPHVFEYSDAQILLCSAQSVDPCTQNCVRLHKLATKVIL